MAQVQPPQRQKADVVPAEIPKPKPRIPQEIDHVAAEQIRQQQVQQIKANFWAGKNYTLNPTWGRRISLLWDKVWGNISQTSYQTQLRIWDLQAASQIEKKEEQAAKILENLTKAKEYVQTNDFEKSSLDDKVDYLKAVVDYIPEKLEGNAALLKAYLQLQDVVIREPEVQEEDQVNKKENKDWKVLAALKDLNIFSTDNKYDKSLVNAISKQLQDLHQKGAISFNSQMILESLEPVNKGWNTPEFSKLDFAKKREYLQGLMNGVAPYKEMLAETQTKPLEDALKAFDSMASQKTQDLLAKVKKEYKPNASEADLGKLYKPILDLKNEIYADTTKYGHSIRAAFAEQLYQSLGRECYCSLMQHVLKQEAPTQTPDQQYFREKSFFSLLYGYFVQKKVFEKFDVKEFTEDTERNLGKIIAFVGDHSKDPEIVELQGIHMAFLEELKKRTAATHSKQDPFKMSSSYFMLIGMSPKITDQLGKQGSKIAGDLQKAAKLPETEKPAKMSRAEWLIGLLGVKRPEKKK
jgi:hypothetical protein